MDSNKKKILAEATTFGIAMCGDGATVHRMPLMNILCLSGEQPPVVLGIEDCTAHTADGSTKNASYVANLFCGKIDEVDPDGTYC